MAEKIGGIYASLTLEDSGFAAGFKRSERIADASMSKVSRSVGLATRATDQFRASASQPIKPYAAISAARAFENVNSRVGLLRGTLLATTAAFGGFTAALATNVISRYADTYTALNNKLVSTSQTLSQASAKFELLQDIASRSRSDLSSTVTLFSRLEKSAPGRGVDNILRTVETIQKALQLGGATAQEASSAAIQFSQAIASNRLGGEELRAILETPLGGALAKGLGVTIGKMREMGTAGELTADVMFKALDKIGGSIESDFVRSIPTLESAITRLDSAFIQSVGTLNEEYGVTRRLGSGIISLADNMDSLLPKAAALGIGLAAVFGGRALGGVGQSTIGRAFLSSRAGIAASTAKVDEAKEAIRRYKSELIALKDIEARARTRASGDTSALASKELVRELERAKDAAKRSGEEVAALTDRQAKARQNLAAITGATSTRIVSSLNGVTEAEKKLAAQVEQRAALQRKLSGANSFQTAAAGQAAVGRSEENITKSLRQRVAIQTQIAATEAGIAKQAEVITQKRVALSKLEADDKVKQSTRIIEAQRKVAVLDQQILASRARGASSAATIPQLQDRVGASGQRAAAGDVDTALLARQGVQQQLRAASQGLSGAQKAATGLGLALSGVRAAGSGLVSFLGGPWGLAFTAAIGIMAALGAKSAATAEEMDRAIASRDRLLGNAGAKSPEVAKTFENLINDKNIEQAKVALDDQKNLFDGLTVSAKDAAFAIDELRTARGDFVATPDASRATAEMDVLIQRLQDGKIRSADFFAAVDKMFKAFDVPKGDQAFTILDQFRDAKDEIQATTDAIGQAKKELIGFENVKAFGTDDLALYRTEMRKLQQEEAAFQGSRKSLGKGADDTAALQLLSERERSILQIRNKLLDDLAKAGGVETDRIRALADVRSAEIQALQELRSGTFDTGAVQEFIQQASATATALQSINLSGLESATSLYERAKAVSSLKTEIAALQNLLVTGSKADLSKFFDATELKTAGPAIASAQAKLKTFVDQIAAGKPVSTDMVQSLIEIKSSLNSLGAAPGLDTLINQMIEVGLQTDLTSRKLGEAQEKLANFSTITPTFISIQETTREATKFAAILSESERRAAALASTLQRLTIPIDLSSLSNLQGNPNLRSLNPTGAGDLLNANKLFEQSQALTQMKLQLVEMQKILTDINTVDFLKNLGVPQQQLAAIGPALQSAQAQVTSLTAQFNLGNISTTKFTTELIKIKDQLVQIGVGSQLSPLIDQLIQAAIKAGLLKQELAQAGAAASGIKTNAASSSSRTTQTVPGSDGKPVNVNVVRGDVIRQSARQTTDAVNDVDDGLAQLAQHTGTFQGEMARASALEAKGYGDIASSIRFWATSLLTGIQRALLTTTGDPNTKREQYSLSNPTNFTGRAEESIRRLQSEASVIQANLQYKNLSGSEKTAADLRLAEISINVARMEQDLANGAYTYGPGSTGNLIGFATGGMAKVGGGGGTDSQLVQFMATPNEHVGVFTPRQWDALGKSAEARIFNNDNSQTFNIVANDPNMYRNAEQEILRNSSRSQRGVRQ